MDVKTATKLPPDSTLKLGVPDATQKNYPKNYETCCQFIGMLPKVAGLYGFRLITQAVAFFLL